MNSRYSGVIMVVAALIVGGLGYVWGSRTSGPSEADTMAAIGKYLEAHPELLAGTAADSTPAAATPLSDSQVAAIRDLIRDHLIANPEIISDAIDELQRKQQEQEVAAQTEAITREKDRIFAASNQEVLGNPDGDVTLVEFFDYNCGYCKRAHADMKRLIADDKNLRVILKEFPVLGDGSVEAAKVGVAVNMTAPEKYGEFHDKLLSERGQANGERALAIAGAIGLDVEALRALAATPQVKAAISENYDLADKLSLTGTPSYVTPREVVVGAVGYDALKVKIEDARACLTTNC